MKRLVVVLGIILLLLGVAALVHPDISYHQQSEVAKIGSFKATVDEQKVAHIPMLATVALLLSGIVLVSLGMRAKQ
jgi:uncharacterized membrane protein HdeD (DUF308 family)